MAPESFNRLIEELTRRFSEISLDTIEGSEFASLTTRNFQYLDVIHTLGNPTPGEIAGALNLSKASVTALIDRLEKEGYLRKVRSDADRRSFHVHLTEKGRSLSRLHDLIHQRIETYLITPLSEEETTQLHRLLTKIVSSGTGD